MRNSSTLYLLLKDLPTGAKAGQRYSNYGMEDVPYDSNHYPLYPDRKNIESLTWVGQPVPTEMIENNPEYFQKIQEDFWTPESEKKEKTFMEKIKSIFTL